MDDDSRIESDNTCRGIMPEDHQVQNTAENPDILVHLKELLYQTDGCDLKFICKDRVYVRASRILLVGRSVMFDTMLTNGMHETYSSVINLPEISSAFLSILEFLYTGNISDFQPTNWKMAFEIISAADFFLLQGVDKIIKEYLWTLVSDITDQLHRAATMLTVALEFKCFHHDEDTALLRLVHLLDRKWMHEDFVCNLSEAAVDFIMRHTKPKAEDRYGSPMDEFYRFIGVLLWCLVDSRFVTREKGLKLANEGLQLYREIVRGLSNASIAMWNSKDGTQDAIARFLLRTKITSSLRFDY